MRLRGDRFLLNLPVGALSVAGLAGFVAVANPPGQLKGWMGILVVGAGALAWAMAEFCLLVADDQCFRFLRLTGRRLVPRAHARLSFDTRHGARGWVTIRLLLHSNGPRNPAAITSVTAFGYPRAARQARRVAQRLAASFGIPWSEDGLEAREQEENLATQERRTFRLVALWLAMVVLVALGSSLLGWLYFAR
jgi:hypothetical protein